MQIQNLSIFFITLACFSFSKSEISLNQTINLADLFDVQRIALVLKNVQLNLNQNCSRDMSEYLKGLKENKIWALKSEFYLLTVEKVGLVIKIWN
jgi:hypothetical protein